MAFFEQKTAKASATVCGLASCIDTADWLGKAQIVREGLRLGVDFAQTSSSYDPGDADDGDCGRPCGACNSCLLRAKGFAEAGMLDPLYQRFGVA